eukprot:Clim_evm60s172 gene=Clim_evmTU60s172
MNSDIDSDEEGRLVSQMYFQQRSFQPQQPTIAEEPRKTTDEKAKEVDKTETKGSIDAEHDDETVGQQEQKSQNSSFIREQESDDSSVVSVSDDVVVQHIDQDSDKSSLPDDDLEGQYAQDFAKSAEPKKKDTDDPWAVHPRDLNDRMSKSSNRYYSSEGIQELRCHNCGENGHIAKHCPVGSAANVCALCGLSGHVRFACPQELCFNCHRPGHKSKDCTAVRRKFRLECIRCYMWGHLQADCPQIWRVYANTTSNGPPKPAQTTNPHAWCCFCTRKGHWHHECPINNQIKYFPFPVAPNQGGFRSAYNSPNHYGTANSTPVNTRLANRLGNQGTPQFGFGYPSHRGSPFGGNEGAGRRTRSTPNSRNLQNRLGSRRDTPRSSPHPYYGAASSGGRKGGNFKTSSGSRSRYKGSYKR